jgi:hypothetical protein
MGEAGSSYLVGSIYRGLYIPNNGLSVSIGKRSAQARKMEARRAKTPAHAGAWFTTACPQRGHKQIERNL